MNYKHNDGGRQAAGFKGTAARGNSMNWQRDTQTNEHYLPVYGGLSWKVYKTVAKDYALTLHHEDIGHGEDVEFFETLAQAKREAERRRKTA